MGGSALWQDANVAPRNPATCRKIRFGRERFAVRVHCYYCPSQAFNDTEIATFASKRRLGRVLRFSEARGPLHVLRRGKFQ